jgi:hypothetical protein
MKARLRKEYTSFGGAENSVSCAARLAFMQVLAVQHGDTRTQHPSLTVTTYPLHPTWGFKLGRTVLAQPAPDSRMCACLQAMSSNYFLWIIVIISALAVASKLSGAI